MNESVQRKSVLFVCMGNICRSPAGEGVFQALVESRGLTESVVVDSAGTIDYHAGNPADERMRQAATRRGYALLSRARQVTRGDLDEFSLVVAMDRDNLADLRTLARGRDTDNVRLLSSFLDHKWGIDVPDPYYGGARGFEHVLDMIEAACPAILAHLLDD